MIDIVRTLLTLLLAFCFQSVRISNIHSTQIMNKKDLATTNHSKNATTPRHANIYTIQNFQLIWFDNNSDCHNTLAQLRRVINAVNTFTSRDRCMDFLTDVDTAKVFMIISGEVGGDIAQLYSIYIFCGTLTRHE
jgi:hypothetical protein